MTHYLIYCCKNGKKIYRNGYLLNGNIVGDFNGKIEKMIYLKDYAKYASYPLSFNDILTKSCLTENQIKDYGKERNLFALHIKDLNVFRSPLGLAFRAPQNMCYLGWNGQMCVLISIRPEWVEKIISGDKTIEIRSKVIKGCL